MSLLTQTQIGTVGEVTVAAQFMLLSEGRFSPFLPFADDDGIDLIIFDKVSGVSIPVQVKSRTVKTLGKSKTAQFDVRLKTYSDRPGSFLLAILLDTNDGRIARAWLISMSDLPEVATSAREKYAIVPSAKRSSKDRYTPYRCDDMSEVVARLVKYLDS